MSQCSYCGVTHSAELFELRRCRERVAKQRDVIAATYERAARALRERLIVSSPWGAALEADMRTVLAALPERMEA